MEILADKLKILITDDSKLLRKKLRDELEKLGCEVIEAGLVVGKFTKSGKLR